jgi:hypothetical protein
MIRRAALVLTAAIFMAAAQAWADSPNLCCQGFDGTNATGCTFFNPSGNSNTCSGVLVDLNCGGLSAALECEAQPNAVSLTAGASSQYRSGSNALDCRCVSAGTGSVF